MSTDEGDLVSAAWLADRLDDPGVVVVDMRWREDGSADARYERAHIPRAVRLDWSRDIVDRSNPVAFMLAPPDAFAVAIAERGIDDGTLVVAYADERGSGPFRLWWAFRRYGHDTVRVLDGGLETWLSEGRPMARGVERARRRGSWGPRPALDGGAMASAADVLAARGRVDAVVLDSRMPEQFHGELVWFETGAVAADADGVARTPRGPIRAGRVPWARNVPWARLYLEDGRLKQPEDLRALLAEAGVPSGTRRAITYCGVGISASALLFAARRAGLPDVALYDASWDEWGRLRDAPVERG